MIVKFEERTDGQPFIFICYVTMHPGPPARSAASIIVPCIQRIDRHPRHIPRTLLYFARVTARSKFKNRSSSLEANASHSGPNQSTKIGFLCMPQILLCMNHATACPCIPIFFTRFFPDVRLVSLSSQVLTSLGNRFASMCLSTTLMRL